MAQFKSRAISPEEFEREFFRLLTPGIIPASGFISWKEINAQLRKREEVLEYLESIRATDLRSEISDTLLSLDDPVDYLRGFFEILGHTDDEFVCQETFLSITDLASKIKSGNADSARKVSALLVKLGLGNVIRKSTRDILLGVKIGLETHRRKNVGGKLFATAVKSLLLDVCERLTKELGRKVQLVEQCGITFGESASKEFDFVVSVENKPRVGIEANFYTVAGSKPTEIKRAYSDVRRLMLDAGYEMAWITDGKGYWSMRKSIVDAFRAFPNIYTLKMIEGPLFSDLLHFLQE